MTIPPPDAGDPYAPVDYPASYPDPPPAYPPPPGYPPPAGHSTPPATPGYPPPAPGYQQPYPGYYADPYAGPYAGPHADPYDPYRSAAPVGTNGLATASLLLSLGGAVASLLCFIGAFFVIAGIVTGIVALNQIKRTQQDGRGLAIAGIAIGAVVLVIFAVLVGLIVLLANGTIDYSLV